MSEKKDHLDKLLVEKFQQLVLDQPAPAILKEEVFRTLDFLEMFGEVVELYTSKFGEAELNLLDLLSNKEDQDFSDLEEDENPDLNK